MHFLKINLKKPTWNLVFATYYTKNCIAKFWKCFVETFINLFLRNIFWGILEPTMICPPISVCCLSCFPGFEIHWNKYSWGFKGTQRNCHWIWPYGRKFIWESQHWIWRTKGMYMLCSFKHTSKILFWIMHPTT